MKDVKTFQNQADEIGKTLCSKLQCEPISLNIQKVLKYLEWIKLVKLISKR